MLKNRKEVQQKLNEQRAWLNNNPERKGDTYYISVERDVKCLKTLIDLLEQQSKDYI